jgi:hypothetical protein
MIGFYSTLFALAPSPLLVAFIACTNLKKLETCPATLCEREREKKRNFKRGRECMKEGKRKKKKQR